MSVLSEGSDVPPDEEIENGVEMAAILGQTWRTVGQGRRDTSTVGNQAVSISVASTQRGQPTREETEELINESEEQTTYNDSALMSLFLFSD